jgi:mevalonate kinase
MPATDPANLPANGAAPREAHGFAPGKLILLGEHTVVHQQPAIALPFPGAGVRVVARPEPGPLRLESAPYSGPLVGPELPMVAQCLAEAARVALESLGAHPEGLALRIDSEVPVARGLGSSAAVAVAIARAILAAHRPEGDLPDPAVLLAAADAAERVAHGNPSGVDAAAVLAAGPIWFRRGESPEALPVGAPLHLVVADTGVARDTRAAVSAVQGRLTFAPGPTRERFERLGAMADSARSAIARGDLEALGYYLDWAQTELEELGVSAPAIARLTREARKAGALGAKLTGAGCGGCVLALAEDAAAQRALAEALRAAGAPRVWTHLTEPSEPA